MQTRGMFGIMRQRMNSSLCILSVAWQCHGGGPQGCFWQGSSGFMTPNGVDLGGGLLLLSVASLPQLDSNKGTGRRWNECPRPPALFYLGRRSAPVQSSSCMCIKFCKQCHAPSWKSRICFFFTALPSCILKRAWIQQSARKALVKGKRATKFINHSTKIAPRLFNEQL